MASTFKEMYDDFVDSVKVYTEEMDVTPVLFMRWLSKAIQKFQRETLYIESYAQLNYDVNNQLFRIPPDFMMTIELKDNFGVTILQQGFQQQNRNVELWEGGYLETPTDYGMRIAGYTAERLPPTAINSRDRDLIIEGMPRMYNIYNNILTIFPYYDDTILHLWYYPEIQVFSITSEQWSTYNPNTGQYDPNLPLRWFPLNTQFPTMFTQSRLNPIISNYEEAFIDYAISRYLRSKGNANFRVFEQNFMEEVERAKLNKPVQEHEAVSEYMFAPYM